MNKKGRSGSFFVSVFFILSLLLVGMLGGCGSGGGAAESKTAPIATTYATEGHWDKMTWDNSRWM